MHFRQGRFVDVEKPHDTLRALLRLRAQPRSTAFRLHAPHAPPGLPVGPAGSDYTCDVMGAVWDAAKCQNFSPVDPEDNFYDLDSFMSAPEIRRFPHGLQRPRHCRFRNGSNGGGPDRFRSRDKPRDAHDGLRPSHSHGQCRQYHHRAGGNETGDLQRKNVPQPDLHLSPDGNGFGHLFALGHRSLRRPGRPVQREMPAPVAVCGFPAEGPDPP